MKHIMQPLRRLGLLAVIMVTCNSLTGCVLLAAGAGATGGYFISQHYETQHAHSG